MAGTAIVCVIGGNTVSNAVRRITTKDEARAGIGTFEVDINNQGGTYNGTFSAHDAVSISIGGAVVMTGNVDSVHPVVDDNPDVFTQLIRVTGRNKGRELVDLTYDKYYAYQPGDDIIDALLSDSGASITFTSSSGGSSMTYDSKDESLLNSFRKICEHINYDFYVDTAGALQCFAVATHSSGITLTDTVGTNSNLLGFERDAAEATDLKNYIIIRGKDVEDGWTEMNQADWSHPTNSTLTNETTTVSDGIASIKFVKGAATASWVELDFSTATHGAGGLYGRTSLDFSKTSSGEISFKFFHTPGANVQEHKVILTDTSGNVIEHWSGEGLFSKMFTWDKWIAYTIPIGTDAKISRVGRTYVSRIWRQTTGSTFTWVIEKIKIQVNSAATSFFVDGLKVPVQMFSIKQDATSQSNYGTRHLVVYKTELESQLEIDAFAADLLAQRKDPLVSFNATAPGSTGISGATNNWKPGYTVTVNSAGEGVSSVSYRMLSIEHNFDTENTVNGYDFWTNLVLVPSSATIDIRSYEALHEEVALLREIRERLAYIEQKETIGLDRWPALPLSAGDLYMLSESDWRVRYEADKRPISISTATDSVAAGTNTVTDSDATEGVCIKRLSSASSGRMWGMTPDGSWAGDFYVHFRLKVTNNASSATVLQLQIYDETAAATLSTLNIAPDDFAAANTFEVFSIREEFLEHHGYRFRGQFTTGITDVFLDWVGLSHSPVPLASQSTSLTTHTGTDVDSHTGTDTDSHSGTDTDAHSGTDTNAHSGASNVATGNHVHSLSNRAGYLVTGWVTRYCATASGGPVTQTFSAPTASYLDNYVYGTAAASGGSHTHTQVQSSNHSVTQPSNHSVTDPDNHSVTDPDDHTVTQADAHVVTNPNHKH